MRKTLFALVVFFPLTAFGARIVRIEPSPLRVGDYATIEVQLDAAPKYTPSVRTNLEPRYGRVDPIFGRTRATLVYTGYVTDPAIVIGPFAYEEHSGMRRHEAEVKISALPSLADPARPQQSLGLLRTYSRPAIVVTTTATKAKAYVGERVLFQWWAWGDVNNIAAIKPAYPVIKAAGFAQVMSKEIPSWKPEGSIQSQVLEGQFTERRLIGTAEAVPTAAGVQSFPGGWILVGESTLVKSLPIDILVLPRPANARGPMGSFRMECLPARTLHWPAFTATMIGETSAGDHEPPRFATRPSVPVVMIPDGEVVTAGGEVHHAWRFEVHGDRARLPALQFSYFDPVRGVNAEARCDPPVGSIRSPEPPQGPAPSPDLPAGARDQLDGVAFVAVETVALGCLLFSLFVAFRAFLPAD